MQVRTAALAILRKAQAEAAKYGCVALRDALHIAADAFLASLLAECPECVWASAIVAALVVELENASGCG